MSKTTSRKLFESHFPVPANVSYLQETDEYIFEPGYSFYSAYNDKWDVWKICFEHTKQDEYSLNMLVLANDIFKERNDELEYIVQHGIPNKMPIGFQMVKTTELQMLFCNIADDDKEEALSCLRRLIKSSVHKNA